jgi:hypothetical protein
MLGYIDSKEKRRRILTQLNRREFPAPAGAYAVYTLDWISEPQLRRETGQELNKKGEARSSLARRGHRCNWRCRPACRCPGPASRELARANHLYSRKRRGRPTSPVVTGAGVTALHPLEFLAKFDAQFW